MNSELMTLIGGGTAGGGFLFLLYFLLKWVLKQQKQMYEDAKAERESWQMKLTEMHEDRVRGSERAEAFQAKVAEAHSFQREEHQEMVKSLQEVAVTLAKLNGHDT